MSYAYYILCIIYYIILCYILYIYIVCVCFSELFEAGSLVHFSLPMNSPCSQGCPCNLKLLLPLSCWDYRRVPSPPVLYSAADLTKALCIRKQQSIT